MISSLAFFRPICMTALWIIIKLYHTVVIILWTFSTMIVGTHRCEEDLRYWQTQCFVGYNLVQHRQIARKSNQKHPKAIFHQQIPLIHVLKGWKKNSSDPYPNDSNINWFLLILCHNQSKLSQIHHSATFLTSLLKLKWPQPSKCWVHDMELGLTRYSTGSSDPDVIYTKCLPKSVQWVDKCWLSTIPWTSWTLHSHIA